MPGFSPGPLRGTIEERLSVSMPLTFEDARAYLAKAKNPKLGRPLPGASSRLEMEHGSTSTVQIALLGSPILRIHDDATITMDHCGYPTRLTMLRFNDYGPFKLYGSPKVVSWGKRSRQYPRYSDELYFAYENLALRFQIPAYGDAASGNLIALLSPETFQVECLLPFVRGRLRVDREGMPILTSLLEDLVPAEWRSRVGRRVQPWVDVSRGSWEDRPTPPWTHREAYIARWGKEALEDSTLLWIRLPFFGADAVASLWLHAPPGQPPMFRWLVRSSPHAHLDTDIKYGTSSDADLAVRAADLALAENNWSKGPPTVAELVGDLNPKRRPWQTPTEPAQANLFDRTADTFTQAVLRVHWQEPWTRVKPSSTHALPEPLKRRPLPGSNAWPFDPHEVLLKGQTSVDPFVQVWFETANGLAVAVVKDPKTDQNRLVIRSLKPEARSAWDEPGTLLAGYLSAIAGALF